MYKFLFKLWGLLILEDPTANKPIGSIPQLQVPFRGRRANRIYFSKAMCMWGNIAFPLLFVRSKERKESGSKCLDYGLLLSIMCESSSPSFFYFSFYKIDTSRLFAMTDGELWCHISIYHLSCAAFNQRLNKILSCSKKIPRSRLVPFIAIIQFLLMFLFWDGVYGTNQSL